MKATDLQENGVGAGDEGKETKNVCIAVYEGGRKVRGEGFFLIYKRSG